MRGMDYGRYMAKTRLGWWPFCLCKLAGLSYEFGMSSKKKYLK